MATFIRKVNAITFGRKTFKNVLQFGFDPKQLVLSEDEKEDLAKVFYWQDTDKYYFRAFSTEEKMNNAYKALLLQYGEYFNAAADNEVVSEKKTSKKSSTKKSSKKTSAKKSEDLELKSSKKTSTKKQTSKKSETPEPKKTSKKSSAKKSEDVVFAEKKEATAEAVAAPKPEVHVMDFMNKTLDLYTDANGDKYRFAVLDYLQNNTRSIDKLTEVVADFVGQTEARFGRNEKEIAKLKKENAELRKQFARLEKKVAEMSK